MPIKLNSLKQTVETQWISRQKSPINLYAVLFLITTNQLGHKFSIIIYFQGIPTDSKRWFGLKSYLPKQYPLIQFKLNHLGLMLVFKDTNFDGDIANTYYDLQKCSTKSWPPRWANPQFRLHSMFCNLKSILSNSQTKIDEKTNMLCSTK